MSITAPGGVLIAIIMAVCFVIAYVVTVVAVRPTAATGVAEVLRALAEPLREALPWNASQRRPHAGRAQHHCTCPPTPEETTASSPPARRELQG